MAQLQRAEGQIEIKSNADKFFDLWTRNTHLVSEWCPEKYPKLELHEGREWHALGSIASWHYVAFGQPGSAKSRIEAIDKNNRSVWYDYIDGDIMRNHYKRVKSNFQVIAKDEGCIVKWTIEYEKMNKDAPDAQLFIGFLLSVAQDIDARLCIA